MATFDLVVSAVRFAATIAFGLLAACTAKPPAHLAVWSETLAYPQIAAELPTLAEFNADLYLAIRPIDLNDSLWSLLRAASDHGVAVRPWLLMPDEGVWLNENNIAAFADFAHHFLDQAAAAGVPIDWLIFDIEPPFDLAESLSADSNDPLALIAQLVEQADAAAFASATAELQNLVAGLQGRNVRVMAVILPWIVDDLLDGDNDLQDLFNTPFADVPWDEVSVIVYRPTLGELFGVPLPPEFVGRYADDARRLFGERASLALGNVGTPGLLVAPGYEDPPPLLADTAAAALAGVDRVSVYSLEGMIEQGGLRRWLLALTTPPPLLPGLFAPQVDALRTLIAAGDTAATLLGTGRP